MNGKSTQKDDGRIDTEDIPEQLGRGRRKKNKRHQNRQHTDQCIVKRGAALPERIAAQQQNKPEQRKQDQENRAAAVANEVKIKRNRFCVFFQRAGGAVDHIVGEHGDQKREAVFPPAGQRPKPDGAKAGKGAEGIVLQAHLRKAPGEQQRRQDEQRDGPGVPAFCEEGKRECEASAVSP